MWCLHKSQSSFLARGSVLLQSTVCWSAWMHRVSVWPQQACGAVYSALRQDSGVSFCCVKQKTGINGKKNTHWAEGLALYTYKPELFFKSDLKNYHITFPQSQYVHRTNWQGKVIVLSVGQLESTVLHSACHCWLYVWAANNNVGGHNGLKMNIYPQKNIANVFRDLYMNDCPEKHTKHRYFSFYIRVKIAHTQIKTVRKRIYLWHAPIFLLLNS